MTKRVLEDCFSSLLLFLEKEPKAVPLELKNLLGNFIPPPFPGGFSCAQGMASKGRASPLGLLGPGTASGPAAQRPSCEGCWAEGRRAGLRMGAPSPPCHSASTRQGSSHNAPGQDKRGHRPVCRGQPARQAARSHPRGSP